MYRTETNAAPQRRTLAPSEALCLCELLLLMLARINYFKKKKKGTTVVVASDRSVC